MMGVVRSAGRRARVVAKRQARRIERHRRAVLDAPFVRRLRPRRFHAYCVGMPKTGTHSIAAVLRKHYRAGHEVDRWTLLHASLAHARGELSDADRDRFLRHRDRRLRLELESSFLCEPFLDAYVRLFPRSRYILTVRDPWTWLDSVYDHRLGRGVRPDTDAFLDRKRHGLYQAWGPGEELLRERGLPSLAGELGAWRRHNDRVLELVPPERLLVVRTDRIGQRLPEIAAFLGVPAAKLDPRRSHSFRALEHFHVVSQLDPELVRAEIERHCGPLVKRWFPERLA